MRQRELMDGEEVSIFRGYDFGHLRDQVIVSVVKLERAHGGCLGTWSRRKTWPATKRLGELLASDDPGISEWGNPT